MYHQLVITLALLLFTSPSFADLKERYIQFGKTYQQTLLLSLNRATFSTEFKKMKEELKNQYEAYAAEENGQLTNEGNQMALDIEMLEPLEFLATANHNKESCAEAKLLNNLNAASDQETFAKIKKALEKICR